MVFNCRPQTLQDVLSVLKSRVLSTEVQLFTIRRGHIFEDIVKEAKRPSYAPLKKIKTEFAGEAGDDTGGISRELWTLFAREVSALCDGSAKCKIFRHDSVKVKASPLAL